MTIAIPTTFDAYEVSRVAEFTDADGKHFVETIDSDAEAADAGRVFWSLYGHIHGLGADCIGDFATKAIACSIYTKITGHVVNDFTGDNGLYGLPT